MWKGFSSVKDTPSTIAKSEIDMFHTQMAWSFLRLTLQNYLKLQCFPVHISYFLAKLHIFGGYRSREKGNFARRIVKILPHIFPPKSDDCNTSNRLHARFFGYNQNLLTSQERTMILLLMIQIQHRLKNTAWSWNDWRNPPKKVVKARGDNAIFENFCAFARFFAVTS